ncbi:Uncharacterised protein [Mycobacteroides abscessus subsp. abscessus]|nr:Uncharacterised protein [Mycobacteroides abscessus subsp. abscessus]
MDRPRQVRVRRRGRRCAAPAAEVRHQGSQGLRRIPGLGRVLPLQQPRAHRGAPRQGVRPGCRRRAADVGATPRHPCHQSSTGPAVRSVRRMVAEVPQERKDDGPAEHGQARKRAAHALHRTAGVRSAQVPHRRTRRESRRPRRHPARVRSARLGRGLGADHRGSARAGHP